MAFWRSNPTNDEEEKEISPTPFLKGKQFDVEAYASNYRGQLKILRLIFIANRCGDGTKQRQRMQLQALRIAHDIAKKHKNVDLLAKIVGKIRGRLGLNYAMDERWRRSVTRELHVMSEMLQRSAKNCEISYARGIIRANEVRILFNNVAEFYHVHGEAARAFGFYRKSGRFCRSGEDYSELLWRVVVVAVEMGQFGIVAEVAERGIKYANLHHIVVQRLHCALGLAYFKARRYKDAALQFLGLDKELGNRFSEVMATHDIAIYGGLCALATFEPTELRTLVTYNQDFQSYLDSTIELKELIRDFHVRCYSSCFRHLHNLKNWLLLDINFFEHFETLYAQIRTKALILYTESYVEVGLPRVAFVFGTGIEAIEMELITLINTNQIQAEIDFTNKVLLLQKRD